MVVHILGKAIKGKYRINVRIRKGNIIKKVMVKNKTTPCSEQHTNNKHRIYPHEKAINAVVWTI